MTQPTCRHFKNSNTMVTMTAWQKFSTKGVISMRVTTCVAYPSSVTSSAIVTTEEMLGGERTLWKSKQDTVFSSIHSHKSLCARRTPISRVWRECASFFDDMDGGSQHNECGQQQKGVEWKCSVVNRVHVGFALGWCMNQRSSQSSDCPSVRQPRETWQLVAQLFAKVVECFGFSCSQKFGGCSHEQSSFNWWYFWD